MPFLKHVEYLKQKYAEKRSREFAIIRLYTQFLIVSCTSNNYIEVPKCKNYGIEAHEHKGSYLYSQYIKSNY
jgi:hypothetical protein